MNVDPIWFQSGTPFDDSGAYISVEGFHQHPAYTTIIAGRPYLHSRHLDVHPLELQFRDGVAYIDIDTFREFQELPTPTGWYWCEFYGGSKEYRCFLLPGHLRRAEIFQIKKYNQLLDESVEPIYQGNGLYVRQDPSHAMPGFYIVSPDKGFQSIDMLELILYMQMRLVDYEVGMAMQAVLGISKIFRVNEERKVAHQNVHTWLLPLTWLDTAPSILDVNTLDYMLTFSSWRQHKDSIIGANKLMRHYLESRGVTKRFDSFFLRMQQFSRKRSLLQDELSDAVADSKSGDDSIVLYRNRGIIAKLDAQAVIPGAYCIFSEPDVRGAEQNPITVYLRMRLLEYMVRTGLRERGNVSHAYKLQEDKGFGAHTSVIRILPIVDIERYDRIYHFTISEYIQEHSSRERNSSAVKSMHLALRSYLTDVRMLEQDNLLHDQLSEWLMDVPSEGRLP